MDPTGDAQQESNAADTGVLQKDHDADSIGHNENTQEIFSTDYKPTQIAGQPLSVLPEEEDPIESTQPTIQVSVDDSSVPLQTSANVSDASPNLGVQPHANQSLSPNVSRSPNHQRRRSSTSGHRRKSSARSLKGLGITAERRASIASNQEFEEYQEGDAGSEFGDFGDFDDFEEGSFSDDEPTQGEVVEQSNLQPSSRQTIALPNITNATDVRNYTSRSLEAMFSLTPEEKLNAGDTEQSNEVMNEGNTDNPDSDDEDESPFMLTDRAISLWKQLTAPPPLQPPDWKRSRIRRLFLVSLGIPVDLDEILPKMTHKKLVLPSTKRHKDKKGADVRRSRKKIPPPPEFEIIAARQLCKTTSEAITLMDSHERAVHIATLKAHTTAASALLTYWLEQRESAQSEKDTFEQVVSNLVQYHKKQKDEQKETASKASKKKTSRFSMRG